jgi:plastocyanin
MIPRALALWIALLGCGSKHEPKTYQVEIRAMQFVPSQLTIDVGDTVVWTNHDVLPHTVTSGIPAPTTFDSKEIATQKQWTLTVSASGEYNYVCTYHPTMSGKLVVR